MHAVHNRYEVRIIVFTLEILKLIFMNSSLLTRIGVWLFALIIGFFGINHFLNANAMAGMVPKMFPGGVIWLYITGAGFILAAISFLIGKQTKWAGILLALMLLIFVFTIHIPNLNSEDANLKAMAMSGALKDSAMAAAALMIAGRSGS